MPHQFGDQKTAVHCREAFVEALAGIGQRQVVHAVGVAGGHQAELAGRVAIQQVMLDHPVDYQLVDARRDALGIVVGRGQRADNERILAQRDELGKYLFTGSAEQETGLAVLRAAADRGGKTADQSARQLGHENHRRLTGLELAGVEPLHGAPRRGFADAARARQPVRIAADVVPVIALHAVAGLADHRATDAVPGLVLRLQEAVGIAVNRNPGIQIHRCALGDPTDGRGRVRGIQWPSTRLRRDRHRGPPRYSARCHRLTRRSCGSRRDRDSRCWHWPCGGRNRR